MKHIITIVWDSGTDIDGFDTEVLEEIRSGFTKVIRDLVDEKVQHLNAILGS